MVTFITNAHILIVIFLVVVVLLQSGKGAESGALLTGGSQTLFGATGGANLLTKLTTVLAICFMATSLVLTIAKNKSTESSVFNDPATAAAVAPVDTKTETAADPATKTENSDSKK